MRRIDESSRQLGEYLLLPNYTGEDCTLDNVDLTTPLVRHRIGEAPEITLATPMVSAIMQAVSSPRLAAALAECGGLSFLAHNQEIRSQTEMVRAVKRQKAGFRQSEANVKPTATLGDVAEILQQTNQEVAVVTDDGNPEGRFLGMISLADFHPQRHSTDEFVSTRMREARKLDTATPDITLSAANAMLWERRLEALPIVDDKGRLASIVLRSDYERHKRFHNETIDGEKRFRVGAGVNTHDYEDRIPALVDAGADVLCIDSSDGFSVWQQKTISFVREHYGEAVRIGAGNVVDARGFRFLAEQGADFVKVGIGGGSICITRDQKGIGRGQASALIDVVSERDTFAKQSGMYVPVCCDGGLLSDSDMAVAFALGADFVMLGRYFARFDESPSRRVHANGRFMKEYWGEGSRRAASWRRYDQGGEGLRFEEGVDGYVPYAGNIYDNVDTTLAKLKSTMVSCGSLTLKELHETAVLVTVSPETYRHNVAEVDVPEGPSSLEMGY